MLLKEGKFSIWCFFISTSTIFLIFSYKFFNFHQNVQWLFPLFLLLFLAYLKLQYSGYLFQIGIRSVFLGAVFASGILIIYFSSPKWSLFGLYMCVMSFFHYSEFVTIAWCNPKTLSISSFLLNHSLQYNIAAGASWIEFFLEVFLVPDVKKFYVISYVGFILCIVGEILRKTAMITGSTNFAHVVKTEKDDNHKLVTHGIYGICRHPSYVGWFYWSIGTQILLLNPVCTIAYTIASWRFFKERIFHEEHTLLYFFGQDYMEYQKSVGTGLPGIKGFLIEE